MTLLSLIIATISASLVVLVVTGRARDAALRATWHAEVEQQRVALDHTIQQLAAASDAATGARARAEAASTAKSTFLPTCRTNCARRSMSSLATAIVPLRMVRRNSPWRHGAMTDGAGRGCRWGAPRSPSADARQRRRRVASPDPDAPRRRRSSGKYRTICTACRRSTTIALRATTARGTLSSRRPPTDCRRAACCNTASLASG